MFSSYQFVTGASPIIMVVEIWSILTALEQTRSIGDKRVWVEYFNLIRWQPATWLTKEYDFNHVSSLIRSMQHDQRRNLGQPATWSTKEPSLYDFQKPNYALPEYKKKAPIFTTNVPNPNLHNLLHSSYYNSKIKANKFKTMLTSTFSSFFFRLWTNFGVKGAFSVLAS